jgi:hypothetical protein
VNPSELKNEYLEQVMLQKAQVEDDLKARKLPSIESDSEVSKLKSQADAEEFNRREAERVRRAKVEAETLEKTTAYERAKLEQLAELSRLRIEQELREERMRTDAAHRRAEAEIALAEKQRRVDKDLSAAAVQMRLIDNMPEIAKSLPKPQELKSVQIGSREDGFGPLVGGLLALAEIVKSKPNGA